jgi:hypothetical protein
MVFAQRAAVGRTTPDQKNAHAARADHELEPALVACK